jgi:hypothetical protein
MSDILPPPLALASPFPGSLSSFQKYTPTPTTQWDEVFFPTGRHDRLANYSDPPQTAFNSPTPVTPASSHASSLGLKRPQTPGHDFDSSNNTHEDGRSDAKRRGLAVELDPVTEGLLDVLWAGQKLTTDVLMQYLRKKTGRKFKREVSLDPGCREQPVATGMGGFSSTVQSPGTRRYESVLTGY